MLRWNAWAIAVSRPASSTRRKSTSDRIQPERRPILDLAKNAAIESDDLTVKEGAGRRGEVEHGGGEIFRLPPSPDWSSVLDVGEIFGILRENARHRGREIARCDHIARDAHRAQFHGKGAGEGGHCPLRCSIAGHGDARAVSRNRADHDDPPESGPFHLWQYRLRNVHGSEVVDIHQIARIIKGVFLETLANVVASIVDHDADVPNSAGDSCGSRMGGFAVEAGCPIEGLLAAGATTGGLEGGSFAGYSGGLSKASVFGIIAAETVAALQVS